MKKITGITFKYIWKEIIDDEITHIVRWKSPMLEPSVQYLIADLRPNIDIDLEYHAMG